MATISQPITLVCFITTIWLLSLTKASKTSFTFKTDFIHRDSPLSRFYNPKITHFDRLHNAFQRSITRLNRFKRNVSSPEAPIAPIGGEYLMNLSIGTPAVELIGIADTGSDLTWLQCKPCIHCFKQDQPIFDPQLSASFKIIPCDSTTCDSLDEATCDSNNRCYFDYSYGDASFTKGNLAVEKLTFGSSTGRPVPFETIVIGCGHDNDGTYDEAESGIVGLGGGSLSLVSQLKKFNVAEKFSYCLAPLTSKPKSNSVITFGTDAVVSGPNVVTTPLVTKYPSTYYYLTLEGLSVGDKKISYKVSSNNVNFEEGNVIIDSGTTITFLPQDFHDELVSELEKLIVGQKINAPRGDFSLCYEANVDIDLPIITAHFTGADVKLWPVNTFTKVEDGVLCLTVLPTTDLAIIGNLAQIDLLIGYDLEERVVSFKREDCANHIF